MTRRLIASSGTIKYVMPGTLVLAILLSGCHKAITQGQIESQIYFVPGSYDAAYMESLLRQAPDPAQAANRGIPAVMRLSYLPPDIARHWQYYQPRAMNETPSIEILEVINRYKITLLEVLVRYGGDLNAKNASGHSLIFAWAFAPITPELMAWLLEHGYSPDLPCEGVGNQTALSLCAQPGQSMLRYDQKYEMIKMLLEHGANPDVKSLGHHIMETLVVYHKDNPYALDIIKMLLTAADDKGIKGYGDGALITALWHRREDAALVLLDHANTIEMTDQFGSPVLNVAAGAGHAKCVEILIARGADVNAHGSGRNTPLHGAARVDSEEVVAMLLQAGASVNALNAAGHTPLDVAPLPCSDQAAKRRTPLTDLLISHGARNGADLK